MNSKVLHFLLVLLLVGLSSAHTHTHECVHEQMNITLVEGMHHQKYNTRYFALPLHVVTTNAICSHRSTASWAPIRIKADYTRNFHWVNFETISVGLDIQNLTQPLRDYIQYYLVPAAIEWIQNTYSIEQFTSPLAAPSGYDSCNGYQLPSAITGGNSVADTDLYYIITWLNDPTASFVARAGGCYIDATTYR